MAISAYVGLQGHGKSHGVVEYVILPALKAKRVVFTNMPMNQELLKKDFDMEVVMFDIEDIKTNESWFQEVFTPGAIFVCDEVWKLWPQGLRSNQANPKHLAFIAEHRHMVGSDGHSSEIILATQDLGLVSSFSRQLVETTYRVEKLIKVGSKKKFRVDVYYGCVTGPAPPKSKIDRQLYGSYKESVYKYYTSHTMSVGGVAGDETKTDSRSNALGGIMFKIVPVALVCLAVLSYYLFQDVVEEYGGGKEEKEVLVPVKKVSSNTSASKAPVPKKPKEVPFLGKSSGFSIVLSSGVFPNVIYRFKVVRDDQASTFSYNELTRLNYTIKPINECLVLVTGFDFNDYVMCEIEGDSSWAQNTFSVNQ